MDWHSTLSVRWLAPFMVVRQLQVLAYLLMNMHDQPAPNPLAPNQRVQNSVNPSNGALMRAVADAAQSAGVLVNGEPHLLCTSPRSR